MLCILEKVLQHIDFGVNLMRHGGELKYLLACHGSAGIIIILEDGEELPSFQCIFKRGTVVKWVDLGWSIYICST